MAKTIYVKTVPITVEYRKVKNINLYVKPPGGTVLITAPESVSMKRIVEFANGKTEWILRKKEQMQKKQLRGEAKEETTVTEAQMARLKEKLKEYAGKWELRRGVHAVQWTLRPMKTRWGSCTVDTKRIRINTRLVNYPDECLEYIVVHELCHLIEPSHNQRFYAYMDRFLPDWRLRRKRLKS